MKKLLFLSILYFIFFLSVNAEENVLDAMNNKTESEAVTMEIGNTKYAEKFSTKGCIYYNTGNASVMYSTISDYSGTIFDTMAACVANGIYEEVIFTSPYTLGASHDKEMLCIGIGGSVCSVSIKYGDGDFYSAEKTQETCTSIRVKGTTQDVEGDVTLSALNSPFLYSQNSSYQNLQITINSAFNNYQNQAPAFNNNNGWQVTAENNHFIVNNKPQNHLFYELAMNKVILNRNGQNFASKQDLTNYLQTSDFFNNLGLNQSQKDNSLNYILPILPDTKNYYLTILSSKSIEDISNLDINPPVKTARIYYAIYPTNTTVKTNGDLIFPQINQITEANLLEAGEILVKPEMFVLWE